MNANSYQSPGTTGGNREDLRNILTILEPEDTPVTAMLPKGPSPKSTFVEVLADTLRKPNKTGTREGADANKGNNKANKRSRFGNFVHRSMDTFSVTDVQQLVSERGGVAAVTDEYGNSKAKCVREVKRDIEAAVCGGQDMHGGDEAEMVTRGLFSWIQATAQTTHAVPTDFLTPAGNILSGIGNPPSFTEAQLNGVLKSLQRVYGGKRTYQGVMGDNIIEVIDQFTRVQPSATNSRYTVREDADEHQITLMVKIFESSFGQLNLLPTQFNKLSDATGLGDPNAGTILNTELLELQFLDALHSADLPNMGGGDSGYVKAMFTLCCKNPRGLGKLFDT